MKTFSQIKANLKEQAPFPAPEGSTPEFPSYPGNPFLKGSGSVASKNDGTSDEKATVVMDAGSLSDLHKSLLAISKHVWDYFPNQEIENRLNLYGFTAYMDGDYEMSEGDGEDIWYIYNYSTGEQALNCYIDIAWEQDDDGDFYIDADVTTIDPSEMYGFMDSQGDSDYNNATASNPHPVPPTYQNDYIDNATIVAGLKESAKFPIDHITHEDDKYYKSHHVSVHVSDPKHPEDGKYDKVAKVHAHSEDAAEGKARSYYKSKGFIIHDSDILPGGLKEASIDQENHKAYKAGFNDATNKKGKYTSYDPSTYGKHSHYLAGFKSGSETKRPVKEDADSEYAVGHQHGLHGVSPKPGYAKSPDYQQGHKDGTSDRQGAQSLAAKRRARQDREDAANSPYRMAAEGFKNITLKVGQNVKRNTSVVNDGGANSASGKIHKIDQKTGIVHFKDKSGTNHLEHFSNLDLKEGLSFEQFKGKNNL